MDDAPPVAVDPLRGPLHPDGGHAPLLQEPVRCAGIIRSFLVGG